VKRFTLDGEIIVADERGLPSFKALQYLGKDSKARRG
jgi:ATP-dependent DNA ligase